MIVFFHPVELIGCAVFFSLYFSVSRFNPIAREMTNRLVVDRWLIQPLACLVGVGLTSFGYKNRLNTLQIHHLGTYLSFCLSLICNLLRFMSLEKLTFDGRASIRLVFTHLVSSTVRANDWLFHHDRTFVQSISKTLEWQKKTKQKLEPVNLPVRRFVSCNE